MFVGPITSKARQIGNAVPPIMGSVLGAAIAAHLGESARVEPAPVIPAASKRPAGLASDPTRSRLSKQKKTGTKPELALRHALHARGMRYRVEQKPLPGFNCTADILFRKAKVAVFLDGCFWHGCPTHSRDTKPNTLWWREKIEKNQERDLETTRVLEDAGWAVVRIWEHEPTEEAARECSTL